jgi:putative addiction module component (TIGR02574 family)
MDSIFDLSTEEKLQLVEDLWDDIASHPESVPVPAWHLEEIRRRKANLESRPAPGVDWATAREQLLRKHGR